MTLHSLLEKAHEQLEKGWDPLRSVSEAFREQVTTLQMQLDTKDRLNEKLKGEVIKAQNEQRKSITDTIQDFRKYLEHMNSIEKQTEKQYEEFIFEQQEVDRINNEREIKDSEKISSLVDEVSSLKFKIREIEATNKEKEYTELRTKFVSQEAELQHAKQNLVNYMHSFNTLEERVKAKTRRLKVLIRLQ